MTRYGIVIDLDKCVGCYSCMLVCKDEFWDNEWPPYSKPQPDRGQQWIRIIEKERVFPQITVKVTYLPVMCMHCENAPCIDACPLKAIYRREDGVVIIDPEKCDASKCKRECVNACPYGAIFLNQELGIAQKCTFCAHLLDKGRQPRCVEACPTGAMVFGDLDDPESEVSKLFGEAGELAPERVRDPLVPGEKRGYGASVRYLGLPKPLVGGSVVLEDVDECAEGAKITITRNGEKVAEAKTNAFGDFLVEVEYGGSYKVRVEYDGYEPKEIDVKADGDVNLGEIRLSRR